MTTPGTWQDDAANVIDPLNLGHKSTAKLPGWQTQLAQRTAQQTSQLGQGYGSAGAVGSITSSGGQRQAQANGMPLFDAHGQPIMEGIAGDGSNRSVIEQLHDNVPIANALWAASNPYLSGAAASADRAAGGYMGAQNGAQAGSAITNAQLANATVGGDLGTQRQDMGIVRDSALGNGPSAAEHLARAQLDANIRSQSAMAATARGGNIAAAMRQAAQSGTQQSLQSAQTIAAQRAQEQLNAQTLLTQGNQGVTNAAQANANQSGVLSGQRVQQSAIAGQLLQAGMQGQQATANTYGQNQQAAVDATQRGRQQWADYIQRQYSLASGLPVQYASTQADLSKANQASSAANQTGNTNLVTGILAAL